MVKCTIFDNLCEMHVNMVLTTTFSASLASRISVDWYKNAQRKVNWTTLHWNKKT